MARFGLYLRTWLYLLLLTAIEVGAALLSLPARLLEAILLATTALKILLIAFNFMHLRHERTGLIVIFLVPFLFGLILYFGVAPDWGLFVGTP